MKARASAEAPRAPCASTISPLASGTPAVGCRGPRSVDSIVDRNAVQAAIIGCPQSSECCPASVGIRVRLASDSALATARGQIRRTGGRHHRRTGVAFRDKYNLAFCAEEECKRPVVRQKRLARLCGDLGKVDLSHENQRLRLFVSRPGRGTNSRGAAEPTARIRPVHIDLTWAARDENCR